MACHIITSQFQIVSVIHLCEWLKRMSAQTTACYYSLYRLTHTGFFVRLYGNDAHMLLNVLHCEHLLRLIVCLNAQYVQLKAHPLNAGMFAFRSAYIFVLGIISVPSI